MGINVVLKMDRYEECEEYAIDLLLEGQGEEVTILPHMNPTQARVLAFDLLRMSDLLSSIREREKAARAGGRQPESIKPIVPAAPGVN